MITITEQAAQELKTALTANTTDSKQVFRLDLDSDECSLKIDWKQEGDEAVENGGQVILVMTPEVSLVFADATIDCVNTPEGACLTIHMGDHLSCGESHGGCGHDCSCH